MTADFNAQSILNNAMSMLKQIDGGSYSTGNAGSSSNYVNSIFSLTQNGMEAIEGNDQQKANSIAKMVQNLMGMLSSISYSETTKANQANNKNSKEIDNINNQNDAAVQNTENKIKEITDSVAENSNQILEAMSKLEELGGDKGLIQATNEQLQKQLQIIEENKAILNDERDGDKEAALATIEGASAQITALVGNVQGYQALIEAQNTVVADAVDNISQQIADSATVIQEGLEKVQSNIANMQGQTVVNTQVATSGGVDKAVGKGLETTGEAMTKTPATAATGAKAIVKGNIKSNTGDTKIQGATQNLSKVTASIGQMGSDLTNLANLTNSIGSIGEGAIELVGQYESALEPVITAIGSLANVETGNQVLTGAINEYKAQLGEANNSDKKEDVDGQAEEGEAPVQTPSTNIKFNFDRNIFNVDKMAK